jgi:hypothetical protein
MMDINDLDNQIECALFELRQLRNKGEKMQVQHNKEKEQCYTRQIKSRKALEANMKQAKSSVGDLHVYAQILKQNTQCENAVPSTIMNRESLLCRALHQAENLYQQHFITKLQSDDLIKVMKMAISDTTEQGTMNELEMLNEICALENEIAELDDNYRVQIEKYQQEISSLDTDVAFLEEDQQLSKKIEWTCGTIHESNEGTSSDTGSISSHEEEYNANHRDMDFIISMLVRDTESSITLSPKGHKRLTSVDTLSTFQTEELSLDSFSTQDHDGEGSIHPLKVSEHANILMT